MGLGVDAREGEGNQCTSLTQATHAVPVEAGTLLVNEVQSVSADRLIWEGRN